MGLLETAKNIYLTFAGQSSTPASPDADHYRLFFDDTGTAKVLNSAGGVTTLGGEGDVVVVEHGSDSTVARPSGTKVLWVGSVEPDNGAENDLWMRTTDQHLLVHDGAGFVDPIENATTPTGARAYRSAALDISDNTTTIVDLDAESFDDDGWHDTGTNPSRITVAEAGRYRITAQGSIAANTTGHRGVAIFVNGSRVASINVQPPDATVRIPVSDVRDLSAGDYVEMTLFQNSGGTLAADPGEANTFLIVEKA